tara:strand:+ start:211 stop:570 length:360 start_codon:yes stop_codon:yes gene_type:complete
MKEIVFNLGGFQKKRPHLTKAEKFGKKNKPKSGVSSEWFIGSRVVVVKRENEPQKIVQVGTTKSTAKWINEMTGDPCSSQKLRRAIKNGHRCNGFIVQYHDEVNDNTALKSKITKKRNL